ncbi:hypothetical protein NUACC21_49120 [Scytonema sp. NUACC21]
MNFYYRKLYALLSSPEILGQDSAISQQLQKLHSWWQQEGHLSEEIAKSSDGMNLTLSSQASRNHNEVEVRHPISGQSQKISPPTSLDIGNIAQEWDVKKVFLWFWRFYPELLARQQSQALLQPANKIIPDCPFHSYKSTVSAIVGAMFPQDWEEGQEHEHPYLLLFTFSPVQEFIKSSRKFLDFWAASYLLHYLSAKLCWHIAQKYGPDAVITPSLWSQEIIDALIVQEYEDFAVYFPDKLDPVARFKEKTSTSLSTAGFPNIITVLIPEKAAKNLGQELAQVLKAEWAKIGVQVREDIKKRVIELLQNSPDKLKKLIEDAFPKNTDLNPYFEELNYLLQGGCWEWNKLWDAQLNHTWECYWTGVPLGNPEKALTIEVNNAGFTDWQDAQNNVSQSRDQIPSEPEKFAYSLFNVGSWWGSLQNRLGRSIQAVKNTRTWLIPPAPGERSTISGQLSAVHPRLHYQGKLKEGGGLPASSMRLFWLVMAEAYPGLFNGSERLNALELTKRMAWVYGGVAQSLGLEVDPEDPEFDYELWIRFPNLSSIAAARFACDRHDLVKKYWETLNDLVHNAEHTFDGEQLKAFRKKTRRPFHVPKTNGVIPHYNGVMFSSRWLADDMSLQSSDAIATLSGLVEKAHKHIGFGDGSPADWWAIILADGDGMGKYVSGQNLDTYCSYIVKDFVDESIPGLDDLLNKTRKRMGPATHVGLNRALLDFSNRLVPHLTEERFCGKVIYSGGDDVMAVLPLEDLPQYLLSLRAAWCGGEDPKGEFYTEGGYWYRKSDKSRPYFTMGAGATISMGIVIAHKSVPLPTVLEKLWDAEKEEAKKLDGKDGLCFRIVYGSGNTLEAVMKGHLLDGWWEFIKLYEQQDISPLLYRLAEELPRHACVTPNYHLFKKAAKVVLNSRDQKLKNLQPLLDWLEAWESWAWNTKQLAGDNAKGTQEQDLANLLRFSAFWVDKRIQRHKWKELKQAEVRS